MMKIAAATMEKAVLKPTKVSINAFFSKYATAKDGFKYEYNNGIIEKTPRTITKKQWYIVDNLNRLFIQTAARQPSSTPNKFKTNERHSL